VFNHLRRFLIADSLLEFRQGGESKARGAPWRAGSKGDPSSKKNLLRVRGNVCGAPYVSVMSKFPTAGYHIVTTLSRPSTAKMPNRHGDRACEVLGILGNLGLAEGQLRTATPEVARREINQHRPQNEERAVAC